MNNINEITDDEKNQVVLAYFAQATEEHGDLRVELAEKHFSTVMVYAKNIPVMEISSPPYTSKLCVEMLFDKKKTVSMSLAEVTEYLQNFKDE